MDDATQGLTALLSWSTDFNGGAYNLAGSIAAALLGVALNMGLQKVQESPHVLQETPP